MSLYQLSFMVGVALGPAVGGVLLGAAPNAIWWGGAVVMALTGIGFLRLGNQVPEPLVSEGRRRRRPDRLTAFDD